MPGSRLERIWGSGRTTCIGPRPKRISRRYKYPWGDRGKAHNKRAIPGRDCPGAASGTRGLALHTKGGPGGADGLHADPVGAVGRVAQHAGSPVGAGRTAGHAVAGTAVLAVDAAAEGVVSVPTRRSGSQLRVRGWTNDGDWKKATGAKKAQEAEEMTAARSVPALRRPRPSTLGA